MLTISGIQPTSGIGALSQEDIIAREIAKRQATRICIGMCFTTLAYSFPALSVQMTFGNGFGVRFGVVDTLRAAGLCTEEGCRTLQGEV